MNKSTETYSTSDLFFASYILASGCPIVSITHDQIQSSKCIFNFGKSDLLLKCTKAYFDGSAQVSVKAYRNAIHNLKEVIFQKVTF